jgi:hypothetical protein
MTGTRADRVGFEYALLRVVPRVERGEAVNVGVIVYAQTGDHLSVATHVDADRLRALDPFLDLPGVEASLAALTAVCEGRPEAGPAGQLPVGQRFRWLVAPRSTVVQPGPVHTGRTDAIDAEAQRLLARLVLPPA